MARVLELLFFSPGSLRLCLSVSNLFSLLFKLEIFCFFLQVHQFVLLLSPSSEIFIMVSVLKFILKKIFFHTFAETSSIPFVLRLYYIACWNCFNLSS